MEKSAGEVRRRESIWRGNARWFHALRFARPRLLPEIILWDTEKLAVSGVGCKATPGFELEGPATCSLARCWPGKSSPQKRVPYGQGPAPPGLGGVQVLGEGLGKLS